MGEPLAGLTTQPPPADAATRAGDPVGVERAHGLGTSLSGEQVGSDRSDSVPVADRCADRSGDVGDEGLGVGVRRCGLLVIVAHDRREGTTVVSGGGLQGGDGGPDRPCAPGRVGEVGEDATALRAEPVPGDTGEHGPAGDLEGGVGGTLAAKLAVEGRLRDQDVVDDLNVVSVPWRLFDGALGGRLATRVLPVVLPRPHTHGRADLVGPNLDVAGIKDEDASLPESADPVADDVLPILNAVVVAAVGALDLDAVLALAESARTADRVADDAAAGDRRVEPDC